MSKRNIAYIKPQDPSFLAKLKVEIGYKEGPTVETKKQKLIDQTEDDLLEERPEREDEAPQIVVLKSGDLTAEEVAQEKAKIAKAELEAKADLNQRVIFQKRKHKKDSEEATTSNDTKSSSNDTSSVNSTTKTSIQDKKKNKSTKSNKLSFNYEDENEEEQ